MNATTLPKLSVFKSYQKNSSIRMLCTTVQDIWLGNEKAFNCNSFNFCCLMIHLFLSSALFKPIKKKLTVLEFKYWYQMCNHLICTDCVRCNCCLFFGKSFSYFLLKYWKNLLFFFLHEPTSKSIPFNFT